MVTNRVAQTAGTPHRSKSFASATDPGVSIYARRRHFPLAVDTRNTFALNSNGLEIPRDELARALTKTFKDSAKGLMVVVPNDNVHLFVHRGGENHLSDATLTSTPIEVDGLTLYLRALTHRGKHGTVDLTIRGMCRVPAEGHAALVEALKPWMYPLMDIAYNESRRAQSSGAIDQISPLPTCRVFAFRPTRQYHPKRKTASIEVLQACRDLDPSLTDHALDALQHEEFMYVMDNPNRGQKEADRLAIKTVYVKTLQNCYRLSTSVYYIDKTSTHATGSNKIEAIRLRPLAGGMRLRAIEIAELRRDIGHWEADATFSEARLEIPERWHADHPNYKLALQEICNSEARDRLSKLERQLMARYLNLNALIRVASVRGLYQT